MSRIQIQDALHMSTNNLPNDCVTFNAQPRTCDFCTFEAEYDLKTFDGPWASVCEDDALEHGVGLGMGLGQRLVFSSDRRRSQNLATRLHAALAAGDFDLAEDIIGDGDIAEFL